MARKYTELRISLLLLGLLTTFSVQSQNLDELWKDFRSGSPSRRVRACEELTLYYHSEARDSLLNLGEDLFNYGIETHYYPAIEQGKLTIAEYFIRNGKSSEGIAMVKPLLSAMEKRGDDRMICTASRLICQGYLMQHDGKSAYLWAAKTTNAGSHHKDPIVKAEGYLVLAEALAINNKKKEAIKAFKRYIDMLKPYGKNRALSAAYARLADEYRKMNDLKTATVYFQKSMVCAKKSGKTSPMAHAINNMGIVYFEEGDTLKAREYFVKALELRQKMNDPKSISESYYNLGDYHLYINQPEKAAYWYTVSLNYAKEHNLKPEQCDALKALSELAKTTGDYKESTARLESYVQLQEQINIENAADDDEAAALQRYLVSQEALHPLDEVNKKSAIVNRSGFDWKWGAIIALVIVAGLALRFRKKKATTNAD